MQGQTDKASQFNPMDIPFTQRLSYKQTRLTVIVAFMLGTLLSLIQVGFDYLSQNASIDREIRALLQISHNPAARITYNIDAELAQELALGLLNSPAVIHAELIDNSGLTLASVSRPPLQSGYRVFSDFLFGKQRRFADPLSVSHAPEESLGVLVLEVDTYAFGSHFLERAWLTLVTGFVRSLLLSLILLVLFNAMLTRPLVKLIADLSERNPRQVEQQPLTCPAAHVDDEIGVLVKVTNRQLHSVAQENAQRREAEDQLTRHLAELEDRVNARTAELKASNERLSQSNLELQQARAEALHTAQARAAFLASMSHEIRTPLNGLLGMLNLARENPLDEQQRQQLDIAQESGKVLMELLNDILDLSKFEAGQLELEQIAFDPAALAEETTRLLSPNCQAQVQLTCLIDTQLPALCLGDPKRVRQIISNLLSNALKFTRSGRVDLRLRSSQHGLLIEVEDTGIGISEEAQARLFQPFTQAAAGIAREYGGTGLGLALCKRLCEAMQGTLQVSSQVNQGSRFSAWLPLTSLSGPANWPALSGLVLLTSSASSGLGEQLRQWLPYFGLQLRFIDATELQAPQPDAALLICQHVEEALAMRQHSQLPVLLLGDFAAQLDTRQSSELAPLQQALLPLTRHTLYQALQQCLNQNGDTDSHPHSLGKTSAPFSGKVLLVEDNRVNQMVAQGMLGKLGCSVSLAEDGLKALERLENEDFDLVLMDCNMPLLDGYQTTRRIRQQPRWQGLPIIALTANALPEERKRCQAAGMDDYLAKPFRREDLAALLEQWLPKAGASD